MRRFRRLPELRSQGVIGAIGAGMNFCEPLAQFGREADFDCFLLAGRYTLLDHTGLEDLLPLCEEKGMSIILGGPYNSGVLASDLGEGHDLLLPEYASRSAGSGAED